VYRLQAETRGQRSGKTGNFCRLGTIAVQFSVQTFHAELRRLEPKLSAMERVYRAPPTMTRTLRAAIKPICPGFNLGLTDRDRAYWESDQNGASWSEYEVLKQVIESVPKEGKFWRSGRASGVRWFFLRRNSAGQTFLPSKAMAPRRSIPTLVPALRTRSAATSKCCDIPWNLTA